MKRTGFRRLPRSDTLAKLRERDDRQRAKRRRSLHISNGLRPGITSPDPKHWRLIHDVIRLRDGGECRRCGADLRLDGGQIGGCVDHVIPRRLLPPDLQHVGANLSLLCAGHCHAVKTQQIERALFDSADCLALESWVKELAKTGPVPDRAMLETAYHTLRMLRAAENPATKAAS